MKASFHRLLFKQEGTRADWEYPFAVAGINVTFMLIRMLDLSSGFVDKFSHHLIPFSVFLSIEIVLIWVQNIDNLILSYFLHSTN